MNFIAGYLILVTKSEEESFWLLDALVGRILPGTLNPRGKSGTVAFWCCRNNATDKSRRDETEGTV